MYRTKATKPAKKKKTKQPKAPPRNPWLVDETTTADDKRDLAIGLTAIVRGGVIVQYDPGVFCTFDRTGEDSGNGTKGHIWTIDPKMDADLLNDLDLCVYDGDGGDVRALLSARLKAIARKFVDLAVTLDMCVQQDEVTP